MNVQDLDVQEYINKTLAEEDSKCNSVVPEVGLLCFIKTDDK